MPLASRIRALPAETKVESGTSQNKSGTYVNLSNSGDPLRGWFTGIRAWVWRREIEGNGLKWQEMVGNGGKWQEMAGNVKKWREQAGNGRRSCVRRRERKGRQRADLLSKYENKQCCIYTCMHVNIPIFRYVYHPSARMYTNVYAARLHTYVYIRIHMRVCMYEYHLETVENLCAATRARRASASAPASGFRVQGSGAGVEGSGFRAQGSGFRVQGLGLRVYGKG